MRRQRARRLKPQERDLKIQALLGIEWVELAFPDVNMLVHVYEHVHAEIRDSLLEKWVMSHQPSFDSAMSQNTKSRKV